MGADSNVRHSESARCVACGMGKGQIGEQCGLPAPCGMTYEPEPGGLAGGHALAQAETTDLSSDAGTSNGAPAVPDVRCQTCRNVGAAYCDNCAAGVFEVRDLGRERDGYRDALEEIRRLWTDPVPAQRQDVAYQRAVRIASGALDG